MAVAGMVSGRRGCWWRTVAVVLLLLGGLLPFRLVPVARAGPVASDDTQLGAIVTFEAINYPNYFLRVRDGLTYLTRLDTSADRDSARFRLVAGLADSSKYSFEAVSQPGYFLRHQSGRLKLHPRANDQLFKDDATFARRPGLADSALVSFESHNFPHYYLRHRNFEGWVESGSGDLFTRDATFRLTVETGGGPPSADLGTWWDETEADGWHGIWVRRDATNTFDATWTKPGPATANGVLTITRVGNQITIERGPAPDGLTGCSYTGTVAGNGTSVSGSYQCFRGSASLGVANWQATIRYDQPPTTSTPPTSGCAWTGTWDTNWGSMTLVQTGNVVTGTYEHDQGRLSGTVSGNVLTATWSEAPSYTPPGDAGDVELTMGADCRSFTARWRYGSSGGWATDWHGTLQTSTVTIPPVVPPTTITPPVVPPTTITPPTTTGLAIWTDRNQYAIGDTITWCYRVPSPGYIIVTDTLPDGRAQVVLEGYDDGRGDCRTAAITPPTGVETLSIVFMLSADLVGGTAETSFVVGTGTLPGTIPGSVTTATPTFSPIRFGTAMAGDQLLGESTVFPAGITRVYAVWSFSGMRDGVDWGRVWLLNGQIDIDKRSGNTWSDGPQGTHSLWITNESGLDSGRFDLILYVAGREVQRGSFTVR